MKGGMNEGFVIESKIKLQEWNVLNTTLLLGRIL